MKVDIKKSPNKSKRYVAIFYDDNGKKVKTTHFGSNSHSNFTIHNDEARKKRYLDRHRKRENWNAPQTAGALSRWILWNLKSFNASVKDYKKRFNLK